MKEVKLMETSIPELFNQDAERQYMAIGANNTFRIVDVFFMGASLIIKRFRNVEQPVAFAIYEDNGTDLVIAGISQHHDNGNGAGNFSYTWTFDKEDLEGCKILTLNDSNTHYPFTQVASKEYSFRFESDAFIVAIMTSIAKIIAKWLTDNATEEDKVKLIEPGVFEGFVEVKNGEITRAIVVDGEKIKQVIKNDDENAPAE